MKDSKKILFLFFYFFALIIKAQETKSMNPGLRGNGMGFTPNKGQYVDANKQLRPDLLFKGEGGNTDVYLRKTGFSYVLSNVSEISRKTRELTEKMEGTETSLDEIQKATEEFEQKQVVLTHRIDVDFVNGNTNTSIETTDQVEGYNNYYYAHCPRGITHVLSYNIITVKNIYNKIDVKYNGSKAQGLKYDIIVNPGGNVNDIEMHYTGMENLYIKHDRLYFKTSSGEMEERIPEIYQEIGGKKIIVTGKYLLKNNHIRFEVKKYDKNFSLIIDPWVTYYGGNNDDYDGAIALDNNHDVIFTGGTLSTNFPVSAGSFQTANMGAKDAVIGKFDSNGNRLWGTHYGGTSEEVAYGVRTDAANNIVFTGYTLSSDFPLNNPGGGAYYQNIYAGGVDAFIVKLDASGSLIWSSYYGGTGYDSGSDVCIDLTGNISITGHTMSANFPTQNPYQAALAPGISLFDAFIVKFNSSGVRQWATYYGGDYYDYGNAIACDALGDIFVGGTTGSSNFPLLAAHDNVNTFPSNNDGFVIKLNRLTGFPIWSTYYGGSGGEILTAITVDNSGNVYAGGCSSSTLNPLGTLGTYQPTNSGSAAFVVRFNGAGVRQWGTYLGNMFFSLYEFGGLVCDAKKNVIVLGDTYDSGFPVTPCSYQTTFSGSEDQFIATLDSTGNLVCSGFIGSGTTTSGFNNEAAHAPGGNIVADGCNVYLLASTPGTYPVTAGAFQTNWASVGVFNPFSPPYGYDLALAKLDINTCGSVTSSLNFNSPTTLCTGQTADYTSTYTSCAGTGSATYSWFFSGGTPATSALQNPTGITYSAPGTFGVKLIIQKPCGKDSILKTNYITVNSCGCAMTAAATNTSNVNCNGASNGSASATISSGSGGTYTYSWSNGTSGTTTATTIPVTNLPAANYTVTITDGACTSTSTVVITQPTALSFAAPTITNATCGVNNGSASVTAAGGSGSLNYSWSTTTSGQTISNMAAGTYVITVTDASLCKTTTSVLINSNPSPSITSLTPTHVLCNGNSTGSAIASVSGGAGALTYNWSNGTTGLTTSGLTAGTYTISVTDASGCLTQSSVTITQPLVISNPTFSPVNATCAASNGSVSVSSSGGTGTLTYNWSNAASGQTISGLAPASYTVTIIDGNTCSKTGVTTVSNSSSPSITSLTPTHVLCNGNSTGSAIASVSGGAGALTYNWSNGTTGLTTSGLTAGTYTISVTDASGCLIQSSITITQPLVISNPTFSPVNATCAASNGSVSVSSSGGTGTLTYNWSNAASGQTISGLAPASYTVTIIDGNTCSKTGVTTVSNSPSPSITGLTPTHILCNGNSTGSAIASVSGGAGALTYNWSNGTTGLTTSGLTAGTYTISVTDASGCLIQSSITITQPLVISNPTFSPVNATCAASNGSVSVSSSGGTGTLTYNWSNAASGQTISGLAPASYTVTIIDGNTCSKTGVTTVSNSPSPSITGLTPTHILCNGNSTGSATASVSGGAGTLTYNWSNGTSGLTTSGLSAGTYTITVTDASGCLTQSSITITQPLVISNPTFSSVNATCAASNGSVSVSSSGGTGSLTYNWSTGSTGQTISGLAPASYTVTITDGNACSKTGVTTVSNSPSPSITSLTPTHVLCNGNNTGSATASVSGGAGALTYNWSNGTTGVTAITGVTAGSYVFSVTDASGCSINSTVNITEPTALNFAAPTITDAACGINNGSASVAAAGGSGTMNYSWSNSTTGQTINGVSAGSYIVTVTDANSCTSTISILINSNPSATINTVNVTNISCNGQNTGSANISASGGTGALTYSWSNNTSGQTLTNVPSGTYVISVTDANGCLTQSNVIITQPVAITTPTVSTTPTGCGINTGTAIANASGGTGILTYVWSNGFTGITNTNLAANTYTVSVYDANNCSVTTTTTINTNNGPSITAMNTFNIICNGQNNGIATVNITGGNAPYTYSWSNGQSSISTSNQNAVSNLAANNYSITVTDNNNCTITTTAIITEPAALTFSAPTITNAACGASNGSVSVAAVGGSGSLAYTWNTSVSGQTISSVGAGIYTVTVSDANFCTKTTSVLINNSPAPTINSLTPTHVLCNGTSTGNAIVNASGTGTLTYQWSNGTSGTTQITNLTPQTYYVTVTDANGCLTQSSVTITEPSVITFAVPTIIDAACGVSDGSVSVAAAGGSGSLNYSWSSSASGQTLTNVGAGNYVVTVTDANSCVSTTSVLINNSPSATIDNITITSPSCNGQNNGSALASASGGSGALTYSWSNSTSGQTITNVTSNTYIVSVTDASGCLTQSSVVITQPTTVSAQNSNAISSTCGNNNGSADIIAMGGTGSTYTYLWSTGASSVTSGQSAIGSLQSSTYYCTVTDQNNCSYVHTFVIGNKPSPVFTGSSPIITAADCKGTNSGQIDVLISSGTAPYTYSWSSGASTITIAQNNTVNNLLAGNYNLTITDNNGCSVDTSLTLTEPTSVFTSTVTATNATCITGGSATAIINGGNTGNYTYSWSNGTSSVSNSQLAVSNNLPAGNYTITVTDSKGCTTISTTTINAPALPTVTATQQAAATCNNSNGVAAAIGSGGSGSNYTYSWSNNATGVTANNLAANNYTVTITDANGCTSTSTTAITNSNGPNIASQNSTGTCVGQATGQAAVAVAGGSSPYTYSWSNGVTSTTTNLTSQISNLNSGTYTLTITDANNCTATATALLPLFPNPTANAGTNQTITNGTSIQLTASGGTSYLWTPASSLSNAGISNPIANPTQTTTYTVTVTDANSCSSTDDITVTVTTPQTCNASEADEFVANVFSPNGDGRNDVLYVKGFGLTNIYFAIYNRWGQQLFESIDQSKGWDGTQGGKPIDEQTVVYYLTATCITTGENIVKKGDVSVVR